MTTRLKQLKTYPFGLFLWLEWIFLGAVLFADLPDEYLKDKYDNPDKSVLLAVTLSLLCILILGAMGLKLPKKSKFYKWLYFLVELALLWLPVISGQQDSMFVYSYLIVIIRNCLIFKSKEYWLANICLFLSLVPYLISLGNFKEFQASLSPSSISSKVSRYQAITLAEYQRISIINAISNLIELALLITLIGILVNVVLREYKSQQELAKTREQLRQYALKAEDRATVNERNRIAREIHDSVGHALTAQTIQLNNAIAFWQTEPTKAYDFLIEAKKLVTTALQDIRHSVSTLRSDPLQEKSLENAIALLIQEFSHRTQIIPQYTTFFTYPLSEEVKITVYRIVQEALTNIAKHSEANEVIVDLQTLTEYFQLIIKDNGQGFNPQQNTTGFGLQGMRERVIALHGNIQISSNFDCGCAITITIPHQTLLL